MPARTPSISVSNNDSTTDPTVTDDETGGWDIGSRWINTVTNKVWFATDVTTGAAVWKDVSDVGASSSSAVLEMTLGGELDYPDLPLTNIGTELANIAGTLTTFAARRGVPGSSGTTTIQLEVNGSAIVGATLSWTSADAAFALKTVSISQAVSQNDRVSFRLTAGETGGEDIFAEART
ncbi:MAG: hypothetical protein AB7L09_00135 [Nitrospira sp.]